VLGEGLKGRFVLGLGAAVLNPTTASSVSSSFKASAVSAISVRSVSGAARPRGSARSEYDRLPSARSRLRAASDPVHAGAFEAEGIFARFVRASEPRITGQAAAWTDGVVALRAREITTRADRVNAILAEFGAEAAVLDAVIAAGVALLLGSI
jgi:hypothetical protein